MRGEGQRKRNEGGGGDSTPWDSGRECTVRRIGWSQKRAQKGTHSTSEMTTSNFHLSSPLPIPWQQELPSPILLSMMLLDWRNLTAWM